MKLLLVEWLDTRYRGGWKDRSWLADTRPAKCLSVGVGIEYENYINIVQSTSDAGDISEVISIPRTSIIRVRELEVKDES